jgi:DNA-binding transcriptional regulator GbsR (MarR family)
MALIDEMGFWAQNSSLWGQSSTVGSLYGENVNML